MDIKEKNPPPTTRPKRFLDNFLTCRRVLNIMVFLGFMVNYMLRVNLNFAIVDMIFRPDESNVSLSTTPFSLPTLNGSESTIRMIRSISNAEFALEDDDDDEDAAILNARKNNFLGGNPAAPQPATATQNPPATGSSFQLPAASGFQPGSGQQTFSSGVGGNFTGKFPSFGSGSGGFQSGSGGFQSGSGGFQSGSGGFQSGSGGFQSGSGAFQSSSGGFQSGSGGFQASSSSSVGNQGGFQSSSSGSAGFQSSSSSSGNTLTPNKNQFSATASESSQSNGSSISNSNLSPSPTDTQSIEPLIQETKVNNQFQAAPGPGQQSPATSDPKVGSAANPLDDQIIGEENTNNSRILFIQDSNKPPLEVQNAQLDDQSITTTAPSKSKKKKKKRHQKPNVQRFRWSEAEQGFLIGSFFWGYICTELPGGRLAEIIGARKVFGYATLGASVVTLLTPMFAKIHFVLIVIIRISLGLFLGPTWPSILPLAGKWIPMNERGKFLSNMMGSTLGAGFTLPICGFIIDTFSWEYVFYITGLLGFIWSILWFLLVFETPADHPRITPEERWYIENNLGLKPSKSSTSNNYSNEEKQIAQGLMVNPGDDSCLSDNEQKSSDECRNYSTFARNGDVNNTNSDTKGASRDQKSSTGSIHDSSNGDSFKKSSSNVTDKKSQSAGGGGVTSSNNTSADQNTNKKQSGHAKAPWIHIVTSIPVWAFVLTHGASVFGYNTITNQLPTFMDYILDYEIKENGILSSFPYIGKYIAALIGGAVADRLLRSSRFTKNFVRKLLTTIGVLIPGCLMIFQIFVGSDKTFSIFVFTAALTANGFVVGGYLGNSLDIAPNFSGTVFGLGNMFSGLSGAVSALLVGYLTDHNQVYGQWQKVFLIVAITYIVGALIFLIFGSTDVQSWNYPSEQKKKTEADSDIDEETGILQATRRRSSVSSALRSYTEDEWDTSSYQSGGPNTSTLRKKRHRKKPRPDTETESFDSSRKKHIRFDHSHEKSTLKPLMTNQHHDSDTPSGSSTYTDVKDKNKPDPVNGYDVKLRKARGEQLSEEDYLLSIRKRASYKEAIENGSHSDYSYDSENKTLTPSIRHQRKIKTRSDSNENTQTTETIKKDTRKNSQQAEQIPSIDPANEKKTRKTRHKIRTPSDDDTDDDQNHSKIKRESYSKKLKSPTSQQSTSTDSDSEDTQNSSKKRRKKFSIIDIASSQLQNVSNKLHKSTKSKEKSLKIDPQPSTSSNQNQETFDIGQSGVDNQKPDRKFHLPLSSEPNRTIKHASSSPI